MPPKVLFIGYVWPEPQSSAAGLRSCSLIRAFRESGWEIHYASSAKEGEPSIKLRETGISTHSIAPNDPSFDPWISELKPELAIFDRFLMEEQYGWRITERSPSTVRVLDTVDLHFLRRARSKALQAKLPVADIARNRFELVTEDAFREMASIYRSDCTLLISDPEMELLCDPQGAFRVPPSLLRIFSFCYDTPPLPRPDEERAGFVVIGNFRHEPNADGVRWLRQEIWPLIRSQLPEAQVHVYGAYPPREMMALTDAKIGFHVKGPAVDQYETLSRYRVNLAPLRFGAGLKGKISDGWWCGTPCVTTSIGAEGMLLTLTTEPFGGAIADTAQEFANQAAALHEDANLRAKSREIGYATLREKFSHTPNAAELLRQLNELRAEIQDHRAGNFVGRMLAHHAHQSTKYFSRWIELKENRSSVT